MGSSGGSRNKTDQSPLKRLRSKGGGEGGARNDGPVLVCLPSFSVILKQLPTLKKGLGLAMREGKVYLGTVEVGALTARQYRMVVACEEEGVGYRGVVAVEKKNGKDYFHGFFQKYRL